jgi:endonuclease-3
MAGMTVKPVNKKPARKASLIAPPSDALREKAVDVYRRLAQTYGLRDLTPRREPMRELISTMLSHRTTHHNEEKAYFQMLARFGTWEGVRDAPLNELIDAIAPANFPEIKAPNIKETVRRIIDERGKANIDFLRDLPADEGLAWLTALPGVGIKTATLVLLFCFGKPVMPVDTHVHRVSQRIGLIGPKVNPTAAHPLLLALLPSDPVVLITFHKDMLKHGQEICIWSTPRCERCPMTSICDWYGANRAGKEAGRG